MKIQMVETLPIYRRLLAEPDAAARETLFRQALVAPFAGLSAQMGMDDGVAAFAQWGMPLHLLTGAAAPWLAQCLDMLEAHDAWGQTAAALADGLHAFAPYLAHSVVSEIVFGLFVADLRHAPYTGGYTGFGAIPGYVMVNYSTPTPYTLARLQACTVHELHHQLMSVLGDGTAVNLTHIVSMTVGEYMIAEGLAESFAAELYGADKIGPWVTDFDMRELPRTRQMFQAALETSGFNTVRGYIFGGEIATQHGGAAVDVPRYAGYALGYHVVQAYLQRTGQSVVAASFVPAREIIAASRFFGE